MISEALQPRVALLESDPWLAMVLRATIDGAGYQTSTFAAGECGWEPNALARFLAAERPQVVVYNIDFPYEPNCQLFQQLRQRPAGRRARFVLMTTNKRAVERLVAANDRVAIVEKPFDLDDLLAAVKRLLAAQARRRVRHRTPSRMNRPTISAHSSDRVASVPAGRLRDRRG